MIKVLIPILKQVLFLLQRSSLTIKIKYLTVIPSVAPPPVAAPDHQIIALKTHTQKSSKPKIIHKVKPRF